MQRKYAGRLERVVFIKVILPPLAYLTKHAILRKKATSQMCYGIQNSIFLASCLWDFFGHCSIPVVHRIFGCITLAG